LHALDIRPFFLFGLLPECNGRIFLELPFLVCDLVGMYFKLFGEFRNRLVALQGSQSDFCFEY
jgi:hypothetical protein